MTKIKLTNRILLGFLIKKRIKGKYIERINQCKTGAYKDRKVSTHKMNDESNHNALSAGMIWNKTPEGFVFWSKFNSEYIKYHTQYYKNFSQY